MYTYKDFETGKVKRTRGKFTGWTERTGPLNVRYAIFHNRSSNVLVPTYCLTTETRDAIDAIHLFSKIKAVSDLEWEVLTAGANEFYCGTDQTTYAVILDEPRHCPPAILANAAFWNEEDSRDLSPILFGTKENCEKEAGHVVTWERLYFLLKKLETDGAYGW